MGAGWRPAATVRAYTLIVLLAQGSSFLQTPVTRPVQDTAVLRNHSPGGGPTPQQRWGLRARGCLRMATDRPAYLSEVPQNADVMSEEWNWAELSKRANRILCCHAGRWTHFDAAALAGAGPGPITEPEKLATASGRVRHTSKFIDDSAGVMEVRTVFEPGAAPAGASAPGAPGAAPAARKADTNQEATVTLRAGQVDSVVVRPGAAIFAGDRRLLPAGGGGSSGGARLELWLCEQSGATREALRVGVVAEYDAQTGALAYLARARQVHSPGSCPCAAPRLSNAH
jgi:hypothetical protein